MKKIIFFILFINIIYSETIKDIANVVGIRKNQLIGYGLVVGLKGTGDKSNFTMQSLKNLLQNSYISVNDAKSKNVATVIVTADLPPFVRQGDTIRVKVASIGDAKSLEGGVLLLTQLKAVDNKVYVVAQGRVTIDRINPTVGIVYNGGIVEKEVPFDLSKENEITLSLVQADAVLAYKVEQLINKRFPNSAYAKDIKTIIVKKPKNLSTVAFLAKIESIPISSGIKKRIIIDIDKGMIVVGNDLPIHPATIVRDTFSLKIKPLSKTEKFDPIRGADIDDNTKISTELDDSKSNANNIKFTNNDPLKININGAIAKTKSYPTVSQILRALKMMKIPSNEIIETIKELKYIGAIDADIEFIGYEKNR